MQPGFLQTGNLIAFSKTRHKLSLNPRDEGDVLIAKHAFAGTDFRGYLCKACGLVAFDYRNRLPRL